MSSIAWVEDAWHGDVPVAAVHGELDASNARELGERVRSLLTNELKAMIVDLSGTTYLDSAGINQLFALGEAMRARQQRLALVVGAGSPIERMLTIIGLTQVELVCPTVPAALEQLG